LLAHDVFGVPVRPILVVLPAVPLLVLPVGDAGPAKRARKPATDSKSGLDLDAHGQTRRHHL
jgi:hypothetical protein